MRLHDANRALSGTTSARARQGDSQQDHRLQPTPNLTAVISTYAVHPLAMFSPALGRVVRSTSSVPACSVCALGRPAALGAVQQPFARPSHQRRPSSSKASIPPDGSNANGSSSAQQTPASANKAPARKLTGRAGRKRSTTPPALNVPHVPPTDYLQKPGMSKGMDANTESWLLTSAQK